MSLPSDAVLRVEPWSVNHPTRPVYTDGFPAGSPSMGGPGLIVHSALLVRVYCPFPFPIELFNSCPSLGADHGG